MRKSLAEYLGLVTNRHGPSIQLAAVDLPKEADCIPSSKNKRESLQPLDVGPSLAFNKPWKTKADYRSPPWTVNARRISLFLLVTYFCIPFEKTPLPWLGSSKQYLCSCVNRILHSPEKSSDEASFLNVPTPNITRM